MALNPPEKVSLCGVAQLKSGDGRSRRIPYFDFGFAAGLRPGEQIALKPRDIDLQNGILRVRRAMTLDEDGNVNVIEGRRKNRHTRKAIQLTPAMLDPLKAQRLINETLTSEYLFCTQLGCRVELNNLLNRVWRAALERAKVALRGTKQMRHTFATISLSSGEDPLWIAKVMGHCNTEMIHRR
jgi:integrase